MTEASTLRFVLLRHEVPDGIGCNSHWDLMIERPGVTQEHRLATWSLETLPKAWADVLSLKTLKNGSADLLEATKLPDHRAHYLVYEGPLSDGRGEVTRSLAGTATWREMSGERCEIELRVRQPSAFQGVVTLVRDCINDSTVWVLEWA